ncbi:MAG: hypothetical protein LBI04_05450 [Treponema sp.]|jgi:hypothetical protein|nr:hypothetical protein [Treponema sp.]
MKNIDYEYIIPLTAPTYLFVGEKPVTVLFEEERVNVKSWREVYSVILKRCNDNPEHHEKLMYLRNKVAGKVRIFLSDKPDGMTRPYKIDENLDGEVNYGSSTLIHILINHILIPAGFDCYSVSLVLKRKY